ncbi:uncharacterized protein LOC107797942 [Nicotiana tabacum]|uniref:Uncharacterized protein LOC107797942 n=1 Tax=Nicotiana tabacum TaxID=4097 RepID=A0AC58SMF8_TOBAC
MASESHLPIIEPEDSPISAIPQSEPAAAEENRRLRVCMLEMWDAWSNGKEPPSIIPGFPELLPRTSGTSNVPIPVTNPFIPFGYPTISANFTGMPSEVRPQAPFSEAPSTLFTAPPVSTTAQPTVPKSCFEPSAFTFQVPQFQLDNAHVTPNSYPQHPQFESPMEQERALRNPKQEEMVRKIKSLEQTLKNMQDLSGQNSVSYSDLCMFPPVHLPVGFKMPKFKKYDWHGDPIAHLKRYCNQLKGEGGKEEFLMAYFGGELDGNCVRMKKIAESFREYAIKWREQVARVKPPMDETEMVNVFLQAQEADYFQNMMSVMGKPFAEAIKIGEMVGNGLKTGRIISQSALRATSQAIQNGSGGLANRKKREEGAMMASVQMGLLQLVPPNWQNPKSASYRPGTRCAYHSGAEGHDTEDCWTLKRAVENLIEQKRVVLRDEEVHNVTNNPLPAHNNGPVIGMICDDKEFYPALKVIIAIADSEARPKAAAKQARNEKKITPTPQVAEKAVETNTGAAPAKDAILYVPRAPRKEQLILNTPKIFEQRKVTLNVPKLYVPKGTYVARGPIILPRLTEPVVISRAPQSPMRGPTAVPWNYSKTMVTYKGKEIMGEVNEMNQPRNYHNLEEQKMLKLSKDKWFPPKKPVCAEEAEEFFRKMKTSKYAIIDQLRNTPSQVSFLSLFFSSNEHQKVLLKTLNEAYVPVENSVEQLE